MKIKSFIAMRKITALFSVIMLTEQLASTGAVLYVHAEEPTTVYSIEHHVTSSWEGGYNAEMVLRNLTDTDTEDWSVTFSTSDEITNLWGGIITECREVTNSDYTEALVEASFEINEKDDAENEKEDTESYAVKEEDADVENCDGFNDRMGCKRDYSLEL